LFSPRSLRQILSSLGEPRNMMPPPAPESAASGDKPLVLLAQPLFPEFAAALKGRYRFVLAADADAAEAAEARVLLVPGLKTVTAEHLDRLPALGLVAATSVGVDHVDLDACRHRGLAVTNAGEAFAADSADYGVGLVLAVMRRVAAADSYVRRGRWATDGDYPLTTKISPSCLAVAATCVVAGDGAAHPTTHSGKPVLLLADPLIPEFQSELPAVTADVICSLPALELVVASSVGVDHIDHAACRRRGIRVTNAGPAFSADYAGARRLPSRHQGPSFVSGKRVGIVGLGRIGSLVARRLAAFGCAVSYHSRSPKPSAPYRFVATARELAADSDVLVLSCALTEETRRMVNREVLEALGGGGVLVNVGRGGLVDEPELVRCLREGVIAGAGLDVYENEPHVPPELVDMDNVVLSDHRAVLTPESIRGALDMVAGNLDAFFAGRPLLSPVTL
ncbi:hypothetical protein EJB05_57102, partial [Eragrostis curvula]